MKRNAYINLAVGMMLIYCFSFSGCKQKKEKITIRSFPPYLFTVSVLNLPLNVKSYPPEISIVPQYTADPKPKCYIDLGYANDTYHKGFINVTMVPDFKKYKKNLKPKGVSKLDFYLELKQSNKVLLKTNLSIYVEPYTKADYRKVGEFGISPAKTLPSIDNEVSHLLSKDIKISSTDIVFDLDNIK